MAPRIAAACATAVALLVACPSASAATLDFSPDGRTLIYKASPDETNSLVAETAGPSVHITDPGATISASAPCLTVRDSEALCPAATLSAMAIDAGNGADHVEVRGSLRAIIDGGDGNDALTGGDGPDVMTGGAGTDDVRGGGGNDRLELRDAVGDHGACGDGEADTAVADGVDAADSDCEMVDRPANDQSRDQRKPAAAPGSRPEQDPGPPLGARAPLPPLLYGGKARITAPSRLSRRSLLTRGLPILVRCPRACSIYAELALPVGRKARDSSAVVLARRSAGLAEGGEQTLKLMLSDRARFLTRPRGHRRLQLRVRITPGYWPGTRYDARFRLRG